MFMQPIIETNDFLIFFDWYTYILEFYHIVCLLFVLLKALFSQIQKGYISMQKSFPLKYVWVVQGYLVLLIKKV